MLHIAIDGRLLAYSPAGISQYTHHLTRELAGQAAPDRMTLLHSARHPRPNITSGPIQYAPIVTPPHHRLEQLGLALELLRVRPTVLHSPDFIPPFFGPWRRVITVHDLGFLLYPETVTPRSRTFYGQVHRAIRVADAIIAVSAHTASDLSRLTGADPSRIHVIPNGVDPSIARVDDPAVLGRWRTRHGIDRRFLLFAGTFEPRKNLPLLLEAFARLRQRHEILLVLLGARGWLYEPVFERIGALGLADDVRVIEGLSRAEWPIAYSAAAALVLPSLYEGFGLPALEAMACGTPVVASDASSLPEVVGEAGVLFPSGDVEALRQALERILDDASLTEKLRALGYEQASRFSWASAAAQTLEVYRQVGGS